MMVISKWISENTPVITCIQGTSASRYARSQRTEPNANEAEREVHDFRCKLTTCGCQELHARGYQPGRLMHVQAGTKYIGTKKAKKLRNVPQQIMLSSAITG